MVDGHQRARALLAKGRRTVDAASVHVIAEANRGNALDWALRLNNRRTITVEQKAAKARELQAKQWSQRRIAAAMGVSQPAVSQWLAKTVTGAGDAPATIVGNDGKVYVTAERKPPGPRPAERNKPPRPSVRPRPAGNKRTAEEVDEDLRDPRMRADLRELWQYRKGTRQREEILRAFEKDARAEQRWRETQEAEQQKERKRIAELLRDQASKSIRTWDRFTKEVRAAWKVIAIYSQLFDDLPAIDRAYERMLDTELGYLRRQMEWFEKKLHPHGHAAPLRKGTVIDVDSGGDGS